MTNTAGYVYTDGVTEANNTAGEFMGSERLMVALNKEPDAGPEAVINNVKQGIENFVNDAPQFDDTTMLCIRYFGG